MQLPQFEYLAPSTVEEACSFLMAHENAALLAGGTDLFVKMKNRKVMPQYVVDLKGISGMEYVRFDERDGLRIGALATIQSLKNAVAVKRHCKILVQAAAAESSVQIRNVATLGGNIVNASPAADAPLALMVAGASAVLTRDGAERRSVPLEEFFTGPGRTILRPGELLIEIHVPAAAPQTGAAYLKHATRRTDIAIVSVAVVLTLWKNICTDVRIGLGSVAPTIMRTQKAEALLIGKTIDEDLAEAAAQEAALACSPIDDIRRSSDYRRTTVAQITKLAIRQAVMDAKS